MFESYKEIFDRRADSYEQAMREFPAARYEELARMAVLVGADAGDVVVDVPSGGGYLGEYLPHRTALISMETSVVFLRVGDHARNRLLVPGMNQMALASCSVDRVANLAGLHHEPNRQEFFAEAFRVLRPGGAFCLADVRAGSDVDGFLNVFVDEHSSQGHEGRFLDDSVGTELAAIGYRVEQFATQRYPWSFPDRRSMGRYCRLLFGIDKADDDTVVDGVEEYLGTREVDGGWTLPWELLFVRAVKPT